MTEDTETLADRIRERMDALGLNPFSAAKRAGLGDSFVRDILRGKVKNPSAERLARLALALETTIGQLLGTTGPELIRETPLPPPIQATDDSSNKSFGLLPIRYELMHDALRKASDVSRPPLGWEPGVIPPAYADRRIWWELQRDDTMSLIVPRGALVQVVEMTDEDRPLIGDGDLVVVQRRLSTDDASINYVERSVRRVVYRYPDLGLWFLEFASHDREFNFSDDVFRESEPTAPRKSLDEIAMEIEDPEERAAALHQNAILREAIERSKTQPPSPAAEAFIARMSDPEFVKEMEVRLEQAKRYSHRLVGKVIRVLFPTDRHAGFGTNFDHA